MTERVNIGGIDFWADGEKFYQQVDGMDPMEVAEDVWRDNQQRLAEPSNVRPISELFNKE